jgi:uncharacterized protein YbaA (DUF1428 family)
MPTYVDGFVTPVHADKRASYLQHATEMAALFKEFGALGLVECWGDDVPQGKLTSFPLAVKLEPGEVVVLSWITWPSKVVRDDGWQKLMADPRMQPGAAGMPPFDGKRLIYGGFEVLLKV